MKDKLAEYKQKVIMLKMKIKELIIFMKEVGLIRYLEDLEEEGVVVSNLF